MGAGGAGTDAWPTGPANNGEDSQLELPDFTQIDASGGGGGSQFKVVGGVSSIENGQDGGSGGGGHADTPLYGYGDPGLGDAGGYTPVEGYDGGAGSTTSSYLQGGGGGASEAGGDAGEEDGGDGGDGIENLNAKFNSDEMTVSFNSKYLIDISSQIEDETIIMNLKEAGSPVLIRDLSDKNSYHVVMPMKI